MSFLGSKMQIDQLTFPDNSFSLSGTHVLLCNLSSLCFSVPLDWLSEWELNRLQVITEPKQSQFYLSSRGVFRALLGHSLGQSAGELQFVVQQHGKLSLANHNLQFNISHSQNWLAVVTSPYPVGIDIECYSQASRKRSWLALAKRFFTAGEYQYLSSLSDPDLRDKFTRLWTQKEAVLKAHGDGLNAGLDKLDLLSQQHCLDTQTYRLEYCAPQPELQCAVGIQTTDSVIVDYYYILNERLEIQPVQPPYISHLTLRPDSL